MIRWEHVHFKTGSMTEHLCKDTGNVLKQSAAGLYYPRGPHIEGLATAPGEAKVSHTSGAAAVQLTAK
jgi:hypothetical protein